MDVFDQIQLKIEEHPEYQNCALLCDAMAIKSGTIFNKEKGCFEGFINYGENIIVDDENKIATEVFVFMLVGLKGNWKYPIGYVSCDKINSENLKCLLNIILTEAKKRDINIHSVTKDGTTANINAMKLFGCKFGNSSENIDGSFSFHFRRFSYVKT